MARLPERRLALRHRPIAHAPGSGSETPRPKRPAPSASPSPPGTTPCRSGSPPPDPSAPGTGSELASSFIATRCLADAPVTVRYGNSYSVLARTSAARGIAVVACSLSHESPRPCLRPTVRTASVNRECPASNRASTSFVVRSRLNAGLIAAPPTMLDLRTRPLEPQLLRQLIEQLQESSTTKGSSHTVLPLDGRAAPAPAAPPAVRPRYGHGTAAAARKRSTAQCLSRPAPVMPLPRHPLCPPATHHRRPTQPATLRDDSDVQRSVSRLQDLIHNLTLGGKPGNAPDRSIHPPDDHRPPG